MSCDKHDLKPLQFFLLQIHQILKKTSKLKHTKKKRNAWNKKQKEKKGPPKKSTNLSHVAEHWPATKRKEEGKEGAGGKSGQGQMEECDMKEEG